MPSDTAEAAGKKPNGDHDADYHDDDIPLNLRQGTAARCYDKLASAARGARCGHAFLLHSIDENMFREPA